MTLQVSTLGRAILFFWFFVITALGLSWIAVNVIAHFDYEAINGLLVEEYTLEHSTSIATRGFVESLNALIYDLFVRGKVLSLLVVNERSILWSVLLVLQISFVSLYLYGQSEQHPNTPHKRYYRAWAALLVYVALSVNLAGIGDWTTASTFALFEMQDLYNFGYWGSVSLWLKTQNWNFYVWSVVGMIAIYTLVKAHVIVTTTATGNTKEDAKRIVLGCSLAAFAPYRLSQFIGNTRDQESEEAMNEVRLKTLKILRVKPDTANKVNDLVTRNQSGLVGLTDLSSSYIPLIMKQQTTTNKK